MDGVVAGDGEEEEEEVDELGSYFFINPFRKKKKYLMGEGSVLNWCTCLRRLLARRVQ